MKTLEIYERTVLARTGYKAHPYKEERRFIVIYDKKTYKNNHMDDLNDPKLKKPFRLIMKSRSKVSVDYMLERLGRTDAEKWLKKTVENLMKEEEK